MVSRTLWDHIVAFYEHDRKTKDTNKVFKSMKFINKKKNGKTMIPSSVKNWIFTLKSFIYH